MTHEFKEIIEAYTMAKQQGEPAVLATVVDVEGSSYRRPGVAMLVLKNGTMVGAVSGGCVEKEVLRQAQEVFKTGTPKIMTYDGKYRLGCEGVLYILIEPININNEALERIKKSFRDRRSFQIDSFFSKEELNNPRMGSVIKLDEDSFSFSNGVIPDETLACFSHVLDPCFQLIIIGAEHDAAKLCSTAAVSGWEVTVVGPPSSSLTKSDFPGVEHLILSDPDNLILEKIDRETAIVMMTHNFAKDLLYLQALKDTNPAYIGLLGPAKRREKILNAFIEYHPEVSDDFLDVLHGPAGLNIGAETPQEIAISIMAEILAVIRNQKPMSLQEKKGAIHDRPKIAKINVISSKT